MIWCALGPFFVSFFGQTKKEKLKSRTFSKLLLPYDISFIGQ